MFLRVQIAFILLSASLVTHAEVKKITIYSDGVSCPGSCDAHVVFDKAMNGTEFAHKAGTKYAACKKNEECHICFESGGKQCLDVMYRGNGPHANTFDFTPKFYQQVCAGTPVQLLLADACNNMRESAKNLERRINCIATPDDNKCNNIIVLAESARKLDIPKYEKCLQQGEHAYNQSVPPAEQRALNCAYELHGSGINSKGKTWKKLLPAACRENTYVGRDGLDCCSGNTLTDGQLGLECKAFYPRR
ncbi:hypothetical protein C3433_20145 [Citrobacter freundii]|uniref:Uncharacterized protein n=1 Tax=Citrobacter arsenatis TaxID=2546350 RepID=A0A4P6WLI9_9ENTR|nr:hypothetical protein [Citrobacter arsenatis]POT25104.1 hypothetical protein C3433_20145 [Citrobacter freundii]QBM23904.1 hypothetical protein E1B03_16295 [Citrobacter arsenatis]